MKRNKYELNQIKQWCAMYEKGMSLAEISAQTNIPKSSIRNHLKKLIKLRPKQQKGRTPWNKGVKMSKPAWNKGLKGNYPYPSSNKGKRSPFKNIPRPQKTRDAIAFALRQLDWNGYNYYHHYRNRKDFLYLIKITFKSQKSQKIFFKVGRTFFSLKKRYGNLNYDVIKIWTGSHKKGYAIETIVLNKFSKYQEFGPKNFLGRTECFSSDIPLTEILLFIDSFFILYLTPLA